MPSSVIEEKVTFCTPPSNSVVTWASVMPGLPKMVKLKLLLNPSEPLRTDWKVPDAGGVNTSGLGNVLVTVVAAFAVVAAPANAIAPAAAKSNLRIQTSRGKRPSATVNGLLRAWFPKMLCFNFTTYFPPRAVGPAVCGSARVRLGGGD